MDFMRFLETLRWRWTDLRERLAGAVAAACCARVWDRVWETACAMNLNEARGYVRARSVQLVATESERILRDHGLRAGLVAELSTRAADLLASTILREILECELPPPARRKAA